MADYTYHCELDAENKTIKVVVRNSAGADVTASGIIELNLAHVFGKHIKGREWACCNSEGTPGYAVFLSSEWYADQLDVPP